MLPRTFFFIGLIGIGLVSLAEGQSPSPSASPSATASPTPRATPNAQQAAIHAANVADRKRLLGLLHIADPLVSPPADAVHKPGTPYNYDESKANPYPIPDPLVMKDGSRVTDADTWWKVRWPEIAQEFETEIYGKIPKETPKVTWEVTGTSVITGTFISGTAETGTATLKTIRGTVDNSGYPAASSHIDVKLYLPADANGPVPVIVEIGPGSGRFGNRPPVALSQILAKGWGCASVGTYSIQADNGAGLTNGVIGIVNKGQPRGLDDWGVLAAWTWGLSRVIDYLETDPAVDAKRLALEGHSRWGKTTMLAAALDPRWAVCDISCSGQGGVEPARRNFGEPVDNVASDGEYHWMAGNYLKYACSWNAMPVDAPELLAMIAPRPVFIGCGTTDPWSDAHGEWLTVVSAGPVWRLLGKKDAGVVEQPAGDVAVIDGDIGYRMHVGGHTDVPDFPAFLKFAEKYFGPGK